MPVDCVREPRQRTSHASARDVHAILEELRLLAAERPELMIGPVAVLRRLDAQGRTDYIRSLRAYFDNAGDVPRAAAAIFLHPNTLRYRLRRMQELAGLDLKDPIERLVAELHLRMIDTQTGDDGPASQATG